MIFNKYQGVTFKTENNSIQVQFTAVSITFHLHLTEQNKIYKDQRRKKTKTKLFKPYHKKKEMTIFVCLIMHLDIEKPIYIKHRCKEINCSLGLDCMRAPRSRM